MKGLGITKKILDEKWEFMIENPHVEKIGVTISTSNAKKMIEYYEFISGKKAPSQIKSLELFGMIVYPSDFISDSEIGIFEIKNL